MGENRESRFARIVSVPSCAHDIGESRSLERDAWVNAARAKLAGISDEDLLNLPWKEKLQLAAASYGFWLQRLGNPGFTENHEWPQLAKLVEDLPDEGKRELAGDLALHVRALGALSLSDGYFEMQNRIHERSYALFTANPEVTDILKKWCAVAAANFLNTDNGLFRQGVMVPHEGRMIMSPQARQTLDAAGVTHEAMLRVLQAASDAAAQAWTEEAALNGIHDAPKPIRVLQARPEEHLVQFNVMSDTGGARYYKVTETAAELLDPRNALHIAFHEPHHALQARLSVLHGQGEPLPESLQRARDTFDILKDFGMRNCQPDVFIPGGDEIRELGLAAYRTSLAEESALYQGNRASIETNRRFMPDVAPKANLTKESPALEKFLPVDDKRWLEENQAGSSRKAIGLTPCPNKPSR